MALECEGCGCSAEIETGFRSVRRGLRRRHRCPLCTAADASRANRQLLVWIGLLAGVLAVVSLLKGQAPGNALLAFVLLPCLASAVVVHEASHALVGWLCGLEVHRVVLGAGRVVARGSCFGVPTEWRWAPVSGLTFLSPRHDRGVNRRMVSAIVAGPLSNLAFAALAAATALLVAEGFGRLALQTLAGTHFLVGGLSLVPFQGLSEIGPVDSDGKLVMTTLSRPAERREEWRVMRFLLPAMLAREEGRFRDALAATQEGLAHSPLNPALRILNGVVLLDLGDGLRAREALATLIDPSPDEPEQRAIARNNLAYASFLADDDTLLPEADALSQEAHRLLGWAPPVRATRGSVLVAMGETEAGLELLEDVLPHVDEPRDRAKVLCALALGYRDRGDQDAAKTVRDEAAELDPCCPLLERAAEPPRR